MRKSMYQTLPLVIGALTLLADSYINDDLAETNDDSDDGQRGGMPGPDLLHARAYELYTQFRPSTAGEWGKKSMFYCAKALALRRGRSEDLARWDEGQEGEELEAKVFEQELRALVEAQGDDPDHISIGKEGHEQPEQEGAQMNAENGASAEASVKAEQVEEVGNQERT